MTLWRRVSCVLPRVQLPAFLRGHRKVLAGRPVLLTSLIVALAVVSFLTAGVAAWFSYDITAGLPRRDAISGLGVTDLQTDHWSVDMVVSGSQKGLMLPPGLAFISSNGLMSSA